MPNIGGDGMGFIQLLAKAVDDPGGSETVLGDDQDKKFTFVIGNSHSDTPLRT